MEDTDTEVKNIAEEYERYYRENGLKESVKDLILLAEDEKEKAEEEYQQLTTPKVASLKSYILYRIHKRLDEDLGTKTVEKISPNSKNPVSAVLAELLKDYPRKMVDETAKEIFGDLPFAERSGAWQRKIEAFEGFEKKYGGLIEARETLAKRKGYRDFLDLVLSTNRVPPEEYQYFLKQVDQFIAEANILIKDMPVNKEEFYSEFFNPCYVCVGDFLRIKTPEELIERLGKNYPDLQKFEDKIQINLGDRAYTNYQPETDTFKVVIRKELNARHKVLDLLHELCHVVCMIEDMGEGKDFLGQGRYEIEKRAMAMVIEFFRENSEKVFASFMGNQLENIRVALFELGAGENKENLSHFNAKVYNRCYKEARQKENSLYMLNSRLIFQPLGTLIYAVAAVNLYKKSMEE